ncbi:MAG TPA: universal stress protein [Bacteroidia bacterium]|nr:universal stress protein [Bacteroidia bacterium]
MKMQIKKILVPTDFSETGLLALEHASFLARLVKAEMLLLHVLPVSEYHFEIPEPVMRIENHDEINAIVEQKLAEVAETTRTNYGILPRTMSTRGKIANEIMQIAQDEKVDLIIMGTHGAKGFEELLIGSNAHKVVTLAPCPVITVQTHAKKLGFTNIVLPIDRSIHSREKVEKAIDLAKIYNSKLHILGLLESSDDNEYAKLQLVLDQVQHAIEKEGLTFSRHTVKGGHLAAEALKFGATVDADLIIIMTDHESALTGLFMGPSAKQIVNHSRIPVLSLKPHYGTFESLDLSGAYSAY